MDNIGDLKQRVEKDPSSTIFVALADEYRKAGRLDEAIEELKSGIDRQPAYMSARVALGKIYLEKGMVSEARAEFEKVALAIPDNLFALKKLASIYTELGEKDRAIGQYKKVLVLNPLDEESRSALAELERAAAAPQVVTAPEAAPAEAEVSLEGVQAEPSAVLEGPAAETGAWEIPFEEAAVEEAEVSGVAPAFISAQAEQVESLVEMAAPFEALPAERVSEGAAVETALFEADASIAKDDYGKALGIYRRILSGSPENRDVLQRMNELKSLLRLLGRGGEMVEEKLRAFLGRVKARRDEFYGRA